MHDPTKILNAAQHLGGENIVDNYVIKTTQLWFQSSMKLKGSERLHVGGGLETCEFEKMENRNTGILNKQTVQDTKVDRWAQPQRHRRR